MVPLLLNQNTSKIQIYVTWIQLVLLFMHIKSEEFFEDIADDVEKRFDTSNYEVNRPLPAGKNNKVVG